MHLSHHCEESIWHFWAHGMLINTCSIGCSSLETHWCLVLFYSIYLYPGRIYNMWLFLYALWYATQLHHWNLHLGSNSLSSQEQRREVSLHLYSRGMVSCWGKIRTPTTEFFFFFFLNSWTEQTVSSNARSCQRDAPVKSFTRPVHAARPFAWLSHCPSCESPHFHPAVTTARWWGQLTAPPWPPWHRKESPTTSYPSRRLMVGFLTLSWWS